MAVVGAQPRSTLATRILVPREIVGALSQPSTPLPDGGRSVDFVPAGSYTMTIEPAPLHLSGC